MPSDAVVEAILNRPGVGCVTAARLARGQGWKTQEVEAALGRLIDAGRAQRVGIECASGAFAYDPAPEVIRARYA